MKNMLKNSFRNVRRLLGGLAFAALAWSSPSYALVDQGAAYYNAESSPVGFEHNWPEPTYSGYGVTPELATLAWMGQNNNTKHPNDKCDSGGGVMVYGVWWEAMEVYSSYTVDNSSVLFVPRAKAGSGCLQSEVTDRYGTGSIVWMQMYKQCRAGYFFNEKTNWCNKYPEPEPDETDLGEPDSESQMCQ